MMSRRAAEVLISEGRVTVNGIPAELGAKADAEIDLICVNGKKLPEKEHFVYVKLNKPAGYVTTLSDEKGRRTVAELVADAGVRLYPVGRLDLNSDGLLIMTNDGEMANALMHPSGGVVKTYRLTVKSDGPDLMASLGMLSEPIEIDGRRTMPARIQVMERSENRAVLLVSIREGRNRQIRRLCENAGLKVLRLTRIAEGPIELGKLQPGKYSFLTSEEITFLRSLIIKNKTETAEYGGEN